MEKNQATIEASEKKKRTITTVTCSSLYPDGKTGELEVPPSPDRVYGKKEGIDQQTPENEFLELEVANGIVLVPEGATITSGLEEKKVQISDQRSGNAQEEK